MHADLHEPLRLRCGAVLPNRIALAPLTNKQSLPDGLLGDDELRWLARRADGGFGLIETCAAYIATDGKAWEGELGIDRDETIPGLARLAERVQRAGAVGLVQLFHGGVRADAKLTFEQPWSASTWHEEGADFVDPRPATIADIERVIEQFVAAAVRAEAAGWLGVEIHGAHGYLPSQFLSRTMNPRTDGWGGDLAGRARLVREITRAVRKRCRSTFVVGVRLSLEDYFNARGMDLDDNLQVAAWLADDGADFIHASLWDASRMTVKRPDQHPLTLLRAALPREVAVIGCGKVWSTADARDALARGADVVALGRSAILNPDWPRLAREAGWEPVRPPMTRADLIARAVSPGFADYLRVFRGLVAD
jgi:2,4-dienoyl-CoA reductase-like NADH-dependent reductase (Old Yellow Enzyme family)